VPTDLQDLQDLQQQIRGFINSPRKQAGLLNDSAAWNKLCSALDVIGDTELAIDAYLTRQPTADVGESYLIVYGILQVLLTQQDAVKHLCESLSIKVAFPKALQRIREIRSNAVGHPTEGRENKASKSNFILPLYLSERGFMLVTVFSDDRPYSRIPVLIPDLINEQRQLLNKTLSDTVEKLRSEEMDHREQHRETKLRDLFPRAMNYYFQKIYEATRGEQKFPLGSSHLSLVEECLSRFRRALQERKEWGIHDSISYHFELIEYPLSELKQYFSDKSASKLNDKDAYIIATFLEAQIKHFETIAAEIDETYASQV
jgi:hypothetical protein